MTPRWGLKVQERRRLTIKMSRQGAQACISGNSPQICRTPRAYLSHDCSIGCGLAILQEQTSEEKNWGFEMSLRSPLWGCSVVATFSP